jgi:hypothetical protein
MSPYHRRYVVQLLKKRRKMNYLLTHRDKFRFETEEQKDVPVWYTGPFLELKPGIQAVPVEPFRVTGT